MKEGENRELYLCYVYMQSALRELTLRDSFCAPEIDIFRAIQQWAERNTDHQLTTSAMSTVRLPLIKLDDLLNVVRLSSLVSADAILDAIKLKTQCKDMELNYRGFLSLCHFFCPSPFYRPFFQVNLSQPVLNSTQRLFANKTN